MCSIEKLKVLGSACHCIFFISVGMLVVKTWVGCWGKHDGNTGDAMQGFSLLFVRLSSLSRHSVARKTR